MPVVRFGLDPAAEYLAAIEWIDRLGTDAPAWASFIERLQQVNAYPESIDGFLGALSTCYLAYLTPLHLPDMKFPWK
jgi:hypothetical protein